MNLIQSVILPGLMKLLWIIVFLFLINPGLRAQVVLVDSIEHLLETEVDPAQRMDLLLGLCRARIFTIGGEFTKPDAINALNYAREINDPVGEGAATLFLYMSEINLLDLGLERSYTALDLAEKSENVNLEIFAIYHIVEHYIYDKNDLENGLKWIREGHRRLRPEVSPKHRGNLYKDTGVYHQAHGNQDSAYHWFEAALAEFRKVGDYISPALKRSPSGHWDQGEMNISQVLAYLAKEDMERNDFRLAEERLKEALWFSEKWDTDNVRARTMEDFGSLYFAMGDVPSAIEAYSEALQIHQSQEAWLYKSLTAQDIGDLFLLVRDAEQAAYYYKTGLDAAILVRDSIEIINSNVRLARAARQKKKYLLARKYAEEGLRLAFLTSDSISLSYVLTEQAQCANDLEAFEEALNFLQQSTRLHEKYNNWGLLISDHLARSKAFLGINRIDSAEHYVNLAKNISDHSSDLNGQQRLSQMQVDIAEARGDYRRALGYQKHLQFLSDSLNNKNAQASLRQEQVRQKVFDVEQEKEAAEREASLLEQRNHLYLALAATLMLLLFIGGLLFLKLRGARLKLAEKNQQLTGLNTTKDRFFGIIAHDLRNPIVALQSADMQIAHYANTNDIDGVRTVAGLVGDTAKNLSRLLDNLLNWALSQQGVIPYRPEQIALSEVVEEVTDLFRPAAVAKKIALDYVVNDRDKVFADRPSLHAILRNLLGNAIKYTPKGGRVLLEIHTEKDCTVIRVIDDGIGIDQDRLPRLFQPSGGSAYGTAGEKGTGLGLTLVKELIQLNKGTINVTSDSGKGSVFTVELPRWG